MILLRQEILQYFTDKEEEFVNLLVQVGIQKKIAKVLVFLASTPETTSVAIERGADMRQPEVSAAMKYLMDQGWVKSEKNLPVNKGRPRKIYRLIKPITGILNAIENEKRTEASDRLALVRKLRDYPW